MLIRPETRADRDRIREIHVAAFADHPFSQQTEHLIVDELRAHGALSISLVAEVQGVVRGHVAFSPSNVGGESGWFLLGPIGVDPAFQRSGIGSALVEAGLDELRAGGARGCALVGDPAFYGRFGFRHCPGTTADGVPAEYVLILPFGGDEPEGEVEHHSAFSVRPDER